MYDLNSTMSLTLKLFQENPRRTSFSCRHLNQEYNQYNHSPDSHYSLPTCCYSAEHSNTDGNCCNSHSLKYSLLMQLSLSQHHKRLYEVVKLPIQLSRVKSYNPTMQVCISLPLSFFIVCKICWCLYCKRCIMHIMTEAQTSSFRGNYQVFYWENK